jgi:UDP-glucose 4-epimerase
MVLITGGTGAVGPRIVQAFAASGFRVRVLALESSVPEAAGLDVEVRQGDVTDPAAVRSAVRGVQVVVHLAARLHVLDGGRLDRQAYDRVNVGGTRLVVEEAGRAGVGRLVFFSTISVYGPSDGRLFTEESSPRPDSLYAETKLAAEQLVLAAAYPAVVLRLGAVYGSRIKGNYRQLLSLLARRRFIPIGPGRNHRTLVYDRDVGHAAVLAARHPAAAGRVFNVTDGCFHALHEIVAAMCRGLGRRPPRIALPAAPVRVAAGALGVIGGGWIRLAVEKYLEEVMASGARIQTELGFVPKYNLDQGWRETVDEMRLRGEL